MNKRTRLLLASLWVLLVLYPNPLMLATTVARGMSPPVDAAAVGHLAASLPSDPNAIRELVLNQYVPYEHDWNIYSVPWYFPSTEEVLQDGRGDCESQAVFLASLLEAKGIPYQLKMSFDHIWVDYENKQDDEMENDAVAIAQESEGDFQFKLPAKFDLTHYITVQADARWHPMPLERKLLLLLGVAVIILGNILLSATVGLAPAVRAFGQKIQLGV